MKILCTMPEMKEYFDEIGLSSYDICYKKETELKDDELLQYEVAIGILHKETSKKMTNLRLYQLAMAGSDFIRREDFNENCKIANASGTFGIAISEYMIGGLIALMRNFSYYLDNQKKHLWKRIPSVSTICSSTILVVGLGDIGNNFARKASAMGAVVYGIRRHPDDKPSYIQECGDFGMLDEYLKLADIVALCLPRNKETDNIMNAQRLRSMKRGSYLINVGRGNCLDYDALFECLSDNIAGALLDVFKEEPLKADSPLYDCQNVIITPHASGNLDLPITKREFAKIVKYNLQHLDDGKLMNVVDLETGYRMYNKKTNNV